MQEINESMPTAGQKISVWRILLMVPLSYLGSALVTALLVWAATGFQSE